MPATTTEPRPTKTPAVDDGEFVDFGYRPIFVEHVNRDGEKLDRYAMEKIAARNNERIEQTGDFCPIAIGHTEDDSDNDPEVVGLMGPYKTGKFGDKWAVWGRERWYKQDADRRRKYPRLSVEYWADKSDPTSGYFDPVCVLGAKTPELDLGVHYAKDRTGHEMQVTRYEMAAAGGAPNTFVPGSEEPERYMQGGTLSPADLQQIVEALKPSIMEMVKTAADSMKPPEGDDMAMDPMASDPDADPEAGDLADMDADPADDELYGGDDAEFDGLDEGEATEGDEVEGEADDEGDEGDEGALPEIDGEDVGESPEVEDESLDPAGDEPAEQPEAPIMADARKPDKDKAEVAKYQKERDDYARKYQKEVDARRNAEAERDTLKARIDAAEAEKTKAVRYQKLGELAATGYSFDLDEEARDCEGMSDEQFTKHTERIQTRYARVPLPGVNTARVPVPDAQQTKSLANDKEKRERYAKQARENCLAASNRGEQIDYSTELERLMKADGKAAA